MVLAVKIISIFYILLILASVIPATVSTLRLSTVQPDNVSPDDTLPLTSQIIVKQYSQEDVPTAINDGLIDAYPSGVEGYYASLIDPSSVEFGEVSMSYYDIILNPAPVYRNTYIGMYTRDEIAEMEGVPPEAITYIEVDTDEGTTYAEFGAHPSYGINPFAFQRVRYAINILVDREEVAETYFLGYARPQYSFLKHTNPMFYMVIEEVFRAGFFDDLDPAEIIVDTLTGVGAELSDGHWTYAGSPVVLKFVIRDDDYARMQTGLYLSNKLVYMGFQVDNLLMHRSDAFTTVYMHDPMEFTWHLYTEGWIGGYIDRLGENALVFFTSSYGMMPGWGNPSYWNYRNPDLDELATRIMNEEYGSFDEYLTDYREAFSMGLSDSVRIWLCTRMYQAPYRDTVSNYLVEVPLESLAWLYNTRLPVKEGDTTLVYGYKSIVGGWNPYTLYTGAGRLDMALATFDPLVFFHPYHYQAEGFRAVIEGVEIGPLMVPSDALRWDPIDDEWVEVGDDVTSYAAVKISLSNYIGHKWHDGSTITWADVYGMLGYTWDLVADPDKSATEYVDHSFFLRGLYSNIIGIRIDTDANTITIYLDNHGFYKARIAEEAAKILVNLVAPVHIMAVLDYIAFTEETYALTDARSALDGIPLLDLTDPSISSYIASRLSSLDDSSSLDLVNRYANGMLSMDEWSSRIENALAWNSDHNNMWISQGPMILSEFHPGDEVVFDAFTDYELDSEWLTGLLGHLEPVYPEVESICHGIAFTDTVNIYLHFDTDPALVKYILFDATDHSFIGMGELSSSTGYSIPVPSSAIDDGEIEIYYVAVYDDDMYPTNIRGGIYEVPFCDEDVRIEVRHPPIVVSDSFTVVGTACFVSRVVGKIVDPVTLTDAFVVFVSTESDNDDEEEEFSLNFTGLSQLVDGKYILEIIGVSPTRNVTRTYSLIIDNSPPSVDYLGLRNVMRRDENITIVLHDLTNSSAAIYLDETLIYNSSFTDTALIPVSFSTYGLSEGEHRITVHAVDSVNNTLDNQTTFIIDDSPPSIQSSGAVYTGVAGLHGLWMFVEDNVGIDHIQVDLWGEKSLYIIIGGNRTYNYTCTVDLSSLSDGQHMLTLHAYDMAGHVSVKNYVVIKDSQAPSVVISGISYNEYIDSPRNVEVTVTDLTRVHSEVSINGSTLYKGDEDTFSFTINPNKYGDGYFILSLETRDAAGNTFSLNLPFYIDTTPPVIRVDPVLDGATLSGVIDITISVTDMVLLSTSISIDGLIVHTDNAPVFTYTLDTSMLGDGPHTISIESVDQLGHTTTLNYNVIVNNTASEKTASDLAAHSSSSPGQHIEASGGMLHITTSEEGETSVTMDFGWTSGNITVVLRTPTGEIVYSTKYTPQNLSAATLPIKTTNNLYFLEIYDETRNTYSTIPVYVEVDDEPPIVNLIAAAGRNSVTINWSVYDVSGILTVKVFFDGKIISTDTSGELLVEADPGTHNITIQATDTLGNSITTTRTLVVEEPETITHTTTETNTTTETITTGQIDPVTTGITSIILATLITALLYFLIPKKK